MIERNLDIFSGSKVEVSISTDTTSQPNFFDGSFSSPVDNLAAFPSIRQTAEIQTLEEFGSEYTGKLSGTRNLEKTEIVVNEVPGDPHQEILLKAIETKTPIRLRNFYVISSDLESNSTGYYVIFDAYVTGVKRTGNDKSVVQLKFDITPDGGILKDGVVTQGKILRQGDFGVGAGVGEIIGSIDSEALNGNRWITYSGAASTNPFSADTAIIHAQANENNGWQITVESTSNKPLMRVRNMHKVGEEVRAGSWVKVYTSEDKPTPAEMGAVAKTDIIDFGEF
ncbi:hypothetical protein [Edwardsiella tarda]|uniref:Uncharacterized protein n=1 Tax=Edwardsiella tarda TaxID=636 RepID=A0A2A7U7N0_EDWTA|nr:hypothetical protein [Edwardsiella tarda]PEH74288.1 hypothetical protein CRM76_01200 [Edwardsiella tarda]